jgi:phytoene/squalene synthetase
MRDTSFYQGHLDRVSRSFAFCIERLEPPFRQWVSLSYLLCRVLDTVEDALWPEASEQSGQFQAFLEFLKNKPEAQRLQEWSGRFPGGVTDAERGLLLDFGILLEDLHTLPDGIRRAISGPVERMGIGMRRFAEDRTRGVLKLADLSEVNRYCFVVAGLVGGLLSRLYLSFRPSFIPPGGFHLNGCHFGLFLQKVNLLKDQRVDEREGRFLLPDRQAALASLRENAQGALDYILSLPVAEKGYRVFCGWSLFIGLASLPWIEESFEKDDSGIKIPRLKTLELLGQAEGALEKNESTVQLFKELAMLLPQTGRQTGHQTVQMPSDWFSKLALDDLLTMNDLKALGMA